MADLEPSQLFVFGEPQADAFLDPFVIEKCFRALAQTNYSTDADRPTDPRQGMVRINAVDAANYKFEVWLNGQWRTMLQHIDVSIPAPVKQIAQFDSALDAWTVDHNLGSAPLVQAYDSSLRLLTPVTQANPPTEQWALGFVPEAVLTTASGPENHGGFVAPWDGQIIAAYLSVAEALTGTPTFDYQPTIDGTPTTGGLVSVTGPLARGALVNSTTITGAKDFTAGQTVRMRVNSGNVAPSAGSVNLFLQVRRTDHCFIQHVTDNRVTITHPVARTGFVVLVG